MTLTVSLNLNFEQREALAAALKGSGIDPFVGEARVALTAETALAIRERVVAMWRDHFGRKNKTAVNLHNCFMCERIIDKIDNSLDTLEIEVPAEPLYIGAQQTPAITVPSYTAKQPEIQESVDAEATGDIQAFGEDEPYDAEPVEPEPKPKPKARNKKLDDDEQINP